MAAPGDATHVPAKVAKPVASVSARIATALLGDGTYAKNLG